MNSPQSFIIENKNNKLELNEKVLDIIEKSENPRFFLFYGKTRLGKSTTLNQLIKGNLDSRKYRNTKPFEANDTLNSITKGCNIFGPIKASELIKRHNIQKKLKKDYDVFFCDTEGISSLDGIKKESIPGILTLLQISTISTFMVNKNCNVNDVKEICSQIQLSRCLKQINEENNNDEKNEGFPTPFITVYISNIFIGDNDKNKYGDSDDEDDNDDDDNLVSMKNKYLDSKEKEKQRIYKAVSEKYPNLNLQINDFDVIPGGPYEDSNKEPPKDDLKSELYWWSINELMQKFINMKRKKMASKEIIDMIRFLFDIFQGVKSLGEDFNLEIFLKDYLTQKFEEYSKKKFMEKIERIKDDIKINFKEYLEIISNVEKAKKSLNECFDQNIDLYRRLIGDKIENFIELSVEQYQKHIKEQIDKEFQSICDNILSDENINELIKEVVEMINKAEFKEDVDMKQINDLNNFWSLMYQNNQLILDYFKNRKAGLLDNLRENFFSKINKIFTNLLEQKIIWENFSKDILINIQKEVNKKYLELFRKCEYQEDIEIYVIKPDDFFNDIILILKEQYFKNLSEKRIIEISQKIKQICFNEYEKIIKNKLPLWKSLKADLTIRIKESIKTYMFQIFNGKKFRDEIDPNLGRKDIIMDQIPKNIRENNFNKNEKKKEINDIIEAEVDNGIIQFNASREKLPLLKETIGNIINKCTEIINKKINELLQQFFYLEEKINFDSDTIFAFLTKDGSIYKNFGSKLDDIIIKLKELCDNKATEYNLLVKKSKPEWNVVKSQKILIINEKCVEFTNNLFKNAVFQDNIQSIDMKNLKTQIEKIPNLYERVAEHKKNEINVEIDKFIQITEERILSKKNGLQNWDTIKLQKLQQAFIEMTNKSKSDLRSLNANEITEKLVEHITLIPKFFDFCKDNERKKEIINEIRISARQIAQDYINNKTEEIKKTKQHEEITKNLQNMIILEEKRAKEEEKKRIELENRLREQERKRKEEEIIRGQQDQQRIQEIENLKRIIQGIREENERRENERRENEKRRIAEGNEHRAYIENLARRTINGEFGNGQTRKDRLGHLFPEVQNRVNEILGFSKRY